VGEGLSLPVVLKSRERGWFLLLEPKSREKKVGEGSSLHGVIFEVNDGGRGILPPPGAEFEGNRGGGGVTSSGIIFERTRGGGGGVFEAMRKLLSPTPPVILWLSSDKI
jgi:hypothetical protein